MRIKIRFLACFAALAFLSLAGVRAWALDPARSIAQFKHTRWTVDDGAPPNIRALAQTQDGFLWLGSSTGLYRFDGVAFEHVPSIGADPAVSALMLSAEGDLWIGFLNGQVVQMHDGRQIDRTPHLRSLRALQFEQDKAGGIWLRTGAFEYPLLRFAAGRWAEYRPSQGVRLSKSVGQILVAADGSLYAASYTPTDMLYRLKPGGTNFDANAEELGAYSAMVKDQQGRIWLTDSELGTRFLGWKGDPLAQSPQIIAAVQPMVAIRQALIDRDGNMWGTRRGGGIFRISRTSLEQTETAPTRVDPLKPGDRAAASQEESYTAKDGLSSDFANPILEDHEGDIWVGTALGIDRFRPANVVVEPGITRDSRFEYLLFADKSGRVFAGDSDTLYVVPPGGHASAILHGIPNPQALCQTPDGDVWLAALHALFVLHGNEAPRVVPNELSHSVMQCQSDPQGRLWFETLRGDFLVREGSIWKSVETHPDGIDRGATAFTYDRAGRLIAFLDNSGLTRMDGAKQTLLWPSTAIPAGRIGLLYSAGNETLIGPITGLARLRGDTVTVLAADKPWLQRISGIVQTPEGDTWFQTSLGIFRVKTNAMDASFDDKRRDLTPDVFDNRDGLPGPNIPDVGASSAVRGGDGRIWFITTSAIVWIDPAHLYRNTLPPPVVVTRTIVDGQMRDRPTKLVLQAGARNVEIDYTALSLQRPGDVRFRYKLDGFDADWIDPGARRAAFYTNIPPGSYRFSVIAANADGVWNTTGATLDVRMKATFFQTAWFVAFCALAAMALASALYAIRLRQLAERGQMRLAVRLAERERIARELHDTLLQGFQGLVLRFQSVANRISPDQEVRPLLDRALERAEQVLIEGRNRVSTLRETAIDGDLATMLATVAEDLSSESSQRFAVSVEGAPRRVEPMVLQELGRITEEAVRNAFRHAHAVRVEVSIIHARRELRLSIQDNGTGFSTTAAETTRQQGHFGLTGMRERAERVGGTLFISSRAGAGTEVFVTIPAKRAYVAAPGGGRLLRALSLRPQAAGL